MAEITLRQLEYLAAIAETGSFTAAAERCRVTQAAVSTALAQLESAVGATLVIRRAPRGLALTAEGVAVANHARSVLEEVGKVNAVVSEVHGRLTGRLTVAVYRTMSMTTIPAVIDWFAQRHPAVELEFFEGSGSQVQSEVLSGRAQVAFVYQAQLVPGCRGILIRDASRLAVMSPDHPLAQEPHLNLTMLAEHPAILLDEEPALQRTLAAFAVVGARPRVPWRSTSIQTIQNVVGRNLAYSILMQTVPQSPEGKPLVFREIHGTDFTNPALAALPRDVSASALVNEAISAVRTYWAESDSAQTSTKGGGMANRRIRTAGRTR